MKIRKHRVKEYWFYPVQDSKLNNGTSYRFKYKRSLMKFLNGHFKDVLNGFVSLHESQFGGSHTIREWFVWYNDYRSDNEKLKIVLKQQDFRGKKYIVSKRGRQVEKDSKKYFAFSSKVINLMCSIAENGLTKKRAEKLVELFRKRGFKDFTPDEDDLHYINGHIGDGISFYHWSDRCNWLRTKTVIEFFKREGLI